MPSFLTQCPHCLTSFRVTDAQLDAADGRVRCGACLGIFSAAANRIVLKQSSEEAATSADADDLAEDELIDDALDTDAHEQFDDELEDEFDDEQTPEPAAAESGDEFERQAAAEVPPATPAPQADTDFLDAEDFDVPLGDLNIDGDDDDDEFDEEADDEFEAEDDDDDEFDAEDDIDSDEEDFDDEADEADAAVDDDESDDDEADAGAIYEEYADEEPEEPVSADDDEALPEEFEPEFELADEDEDYVDAADAALAAAQYEDDAEDPPPPVPPPGARATADKSALRRYLAKIEDEDALDAIDDDAALDALDEPVMLDTVPRRSRLIGVALFAANVLLAGVLVLQYASANLDALSRNARFAALLPYVCRVLECPAPERSQLNLLVSEQVLVRSHPRFAQALEVNLVFRNDATAAQPFPALELAFSDTSNRLLANRLFQPAEYLRPELRTSEMPAQSSLQVTLELADPGSEAVNYTLTFREPE